MTSQEGNGSSRNGALRVNLSALLVSGVAFSEFVQEVVLLSEEKREKLGQLFVTCLEGCRVKCLQKVLNTELSKKKVLPQSHEMAELEKNAFGKN